MIEVRHVCLSFGRVPVLKDVSLEVRAGEHIVLMGPAASGKSTLAKVMDGLLLPDAGDCLVDGISTRDDPMHARRLVGLVFQEPEDQAVARRVEDDIAFGPRNLGVGDVGERVAEALRLAGIEGLAGRNIRSLSGGQKQLVAIAGVLAMRPAYLVLDEPTSMLDSAGTRMVSETIAALKKEGRGVVVITQDPAMAVAADRLIVLSAGKYRCERAAARGLLALPGRPDSAAGDGPAVCCAAEERRYHRAPVVEFARGAGGPVSLKAEAVSYRYEGRREPALDAVSLDLKKGELVVVCGSNGSGKSTLLRCLAGLAKPSTGQVTIDGQAAERSRRKIGFAVQFPERALFERTAFDDIAFGPRNMGMPAEEVTRRVETAIDAVGLGRRNARRCATQPELRAEKAAGHCLCHRPRAGVPVPRRACGRPGQPGQEENSRIDKSPARRRDDYRRRYS